MAKKQKDVQGKHFAIDGKKLEIGDQLWAMVKDDGTWVICHPTYCLLFPLAQEQSEPIPVKADIEKIIQQDKDAHRDHLIAYVGIGMATALRLWMEGVLTRAHFEQATETDEYIELPGVVLGDMPRTVRIIAEVGNAYGTYTAEGEIV